MSRFPAPSSRSRVRRAPRRAAYDRATVEAILDEALVAHLGFTDAEGQPYVIPTIHARVGDMVARRPSARELKATQVLASAKIRTGGPVDDEADRDLPVWSGVIPLTLTPGTPVGAPDPPAYVREWSP